MKSHHSINRRSFLRQAAVAGGAGFLALSLPSRLIAYSPLKERLSLPDYIGPGGEIMLDKLTCKVFKEHLNSTFRIGAGGELIDAELIEATQLNSDKGPDPSMRDPFSIVFRAPEGTSLPQQIFEIKHDQIGDFSLFLVPIGPDDKGMLYEAVFN